MKLSPSDWKVNIPAALRALPQWTAWVKKVPHHPRTEEMAKVNDPTTWGTWAEAAAFYERHQRSPHHGAGFIFQRSNGLVFLDFDNALDAQGQLKPWALPLVEPFLGHTYVERSPSGKGLHILAIGTIPVPEGRTGGSIKIGDGAVEAYCDRRFTTLTSDLFRPGKLDACQPLIDAFLAASGLGEKFDYAPPEPMGAPAIAPSDEEMAALREALFTIDPDIEHPEWVKVGMGLKAGLGAELGLALWDEWSSGGTKYKPGECQRRWASFQRTEGISLSSIFWLARERGGYSLTGPRSTPEEDFADFEIEPTPPALEPGTYEAGSIKAWASIGLHTVLVGAGKSASLKPSEGGANIGLFFERHPRWKGALRYNERTMEVEGRDGVPLDLSEMVRHVLWFMGWKRSPTEGQVFDAIKPVAMRNSYDPVAEYLSGLVWDGVPRINTLNQRVGLEDDPQAVTGMRRWLIGAVARGMRPGVKMQTMLVLHSPQGKMKSSFFERLAVRPEWYSESHVDMSSKDGQLALLGPWIVENGELSGMSKADVDRVKVFIAESTSSFRAPYARKQERWPRRVALGGTTNRTEFLRDSTGARRFAVIGVREDISELALNLLNPEDVAQLWAEAVVAYKAGERWWYNALENKELNKRNEEYYEGTVLDVLVNDVLKELARAKVTTMGEVVSRLMNRSGSYANLRQRDIADIMAREGWAQVRMRVEQPDGRGEQRRVWRAPGVHGETLAKLLTPTALLRSRTAPEFAEFDEVEGAELLK